MKNTTELFNEAIRLAGLENAPADSAIIVPGENISRVLVGIDMDLAEMLLAKQLGFDCVVSHHPRNLSVDYVDVMDHHISKLTSCGIPRNVAERLVKKVKQGRHFAWHSGNSTRQGDAAKLLGMPFMCIHSPADLITEDIVQKHVDKLFAGKPETTLRALADSLEGIPEYAKSLKKPALRAGAWDGCTGKIYVSMSGLTNLGAEGLKAYFDAGIGTLLQMHITEDAAKAVNEQNIGNVLIPDHMASDSIGMNVIADAWEKMGVSVTATSGFIR